VNNHRQCPIPTRGGRDCWEPPHPDSKLGLCARHLTQAVQDYLTPINHTNIRCKFCHQFTVRQSLADTIWYCINPDCARIQLDRPPADPISDEQWREELRQYNAEREFEVVYYLRWADRIKIGTTRALDRRMRSIYHDELLAVEPGTAKLEAERHKQFDHARLPAYKEWFTGTPDLVQHVNALRKQNGEPFAAVARWMRERNEKAA